LQIEIAIVICNLQSQIRSSVMKKFIIAVCIVALLAGGAYLSLGRGGTTAANPAPAPAQPAVKAPDQVVAEANVVPARGAALSLTSGGAVAEVLVQEGDIVQAGQVLVRLDSRHQQADLASAEARLVEANASYANEQAGATPEQIAAVEAQVRQAEAQADQTEVSVASADLRAAQAAVIQAQAHLAAVEGGPKETDRRAREAALAQAQAQLQSQRDQLSANKSQAEQQLAQAGAALTVAQTSYSMAKWNWEEAQRTGNDPITPSVPDPTKADGKAKNKLNDVQKQQYRDKAIQAEAELRRAESAVEAAQIAYDTARQAEVSGIAASEQAVRAAQADLDRLLGGADADERAAARAQLAQAQANLEALRGGARASALDAAQAGVDAAQARLAETLAGAPERRLAVARAQISSAEAALALAKLNLADMELTAPFAGVVAAVDLKANEYVAAGSVAVRLADLSAWQIETTNLTELSVAKTYEGAPATITFDALPGVTLPGKVSRIKGFGENRQGDITYRVTVMPDKLDPRLRWNMTAAVSITVK
jgi:HlyD family secretion protein